MLLVGIAAVAAGAVAAVAGFGIGSILTPLVAIGYGIKLAVVLVAIPHFAATLLRAWRLRHEVDRTVLLRFGIASAAGGLIGASLHNRVESRSLAIVFGCLLVFAGIAGLSGLMERIHLGRMAAWIAGVLSGGFGGLVGIQGGLRAAALMAFDIRKEAFVATGTAIAARRCGPAPGLPDDGGTRDRPARVARGGTPTAGTLIGTLAGERVLRRIPERVFRTVVSLLILGLGVAVLGGVGGS